MLKFQPIGKKDFDILRPYIQQKQSRLCDATLGTLYFWKDYYNTHFDIQEDIVFFSSQLTAHDRCFYFLPTPHPNKALSLIEEYCRHNNLPMILYPIEETFCQAVLSHYGQKATFTPLRDAFDYLYNASDFIAFAGKAYHRQRNHISKFKKNHPRHRLSILRNEDFPTLRAFYNRLILQSPPVGDTAEAEKNRILDFLTEENPLGFFAACLWVDDNIVGFSIAEKIGDTLHVHIEKADTAYSGVYQMLSNAFAAMFCDENILFINRQDDLGDAGLRQSKLSYRPIRLLEKNLVSVAYQS